MNYSLSYQDNNHGQPTVVFLHGMAGSSRYWQPVISQLPPTYRTICLDLLGFGHSPKPASIDYSYEDHLQAITATLDQLTPTNPIILVGHSMGALLAFRLANRQPNRVRHLILISLPLFFSPEEAKHELTRGRWLLRITYYGPTSRLLCNTICANPILGPWVYRHLFPHMPADIANDIRLHTWTSYDRSRHQIIEHQTARQDLENVASSTTILMGQNDQFYSTRSRRFKHQTPTAKLVVADGGHHLPLEQPQLVAGIIQQKSAGQTI